MTIIYSFKVNFRVKHMVYISVNLFGDNEHKSMYRMIW